MGLKFTVLGQIGRSKRTQTERSLEMGVERPKG